jgi:hypothetical protein
LRKLNRTSAAFASLSIGLLALASVTGYLYLETSQSLDRTNNSLNKYLTEITSLQDQINTLNALQQAQGTSPQPGILAQLSAMSNLLGTIRSSLNSSNNAALKSELSSLQEELNNIQTVEARCAGSTSVPQRPVGNLTPVLLMRPRTLGSVCVTYKAAWSDDPSIFDSLISGWESGYLKNGSYPFQMYIGNNSARGAFNIIPTPSSVRPSANVTFVTVLFNVSALANSRGIYEYSAPYGFCGSMPMAVGFKASQLNGSDFPPRPPVHSCIAELYSPVSVSVNGINVTLVNIAPSREYLTTDTSTGSCSETGPGYSGNTPCFTYDRSGAYVFNCTSAAATPSGCMVSFGSGSTAYTLTVWYPDTNKSIPWANCAFSVSNPTGHTSLSFEQCIPVASASFIVAAYPDSLT